MISRVLVANRGEIARRVFATCRRLGIETVAVCSETDAALPYVREADFVLRLDGNAPAETYLRGEAIIAGALRLGADAIHPGYGFLSENADFARAVEAAGLTWIGPTPESMEAMGDKIRAKALMARAGVPVLSSLTEPTEADLPVLIKASAGGGGRGMRIVGSLDALAGEIAAAEQEAASAFGDGTVFVEPYVENARHIEVQVVGDPGGFVVVLGERDCSLQRRHQKVIEEAPAPGLSPEQREALHDAARTAADAIDYRGAGTVEFLVDADDPSRFYFLEMNTRLQVEHPVTEAVTGIDLVAVQIEVAEGRSPDLDQPAVVGHAIEARLYTEDPAADYQPQSGRLDTVEIPHDTAFESRDYGVRLDSGFESGSQVSTHYDAMLAKVIAWAPTREQAIRRLSAALRQARLHGLTTNRDLLVASLAESDFVSGAVSTGFFESSGALSAPARRDDGAVLLSATAAIALDAGARRTVQSGVPVGWRNVISQPQRVTLAGLREEPVTGAWLGTRSGIVFPEADFEVLAAAETEQGWRIDYRFETEASYAMVAFGSGLPGSRAVYVDGPLGSAALREVPRFTDPADVVAAGSLLAPMPGTVVAVAVAEGDRVEAGAKVLVMEAMKMQHTVSAPAEGTVTAINVHPGQQVAAGDVLAVVSTEEQQ